MGCSGSSQQGGTMVAQEPPYPGRKCTYKFVNMAIVQEIVNTPSFCPGVPEFVTLSQGVYFPALADMYKLGFRMATFTSTPGSITVSGMPFSKTNIDTKMTYQGVFVEMPEEEKNKWFLRLEKSVLPQQVFGYSTFNVDSGSRPDHIFQTIDTVSKEGGRLVSVEITGGSMVKANAPSTDKGGTPNFLLFGKDPNTLLGVDIFFDMPHTVSEKFCYSCIPQRMICNYSPLSGAIGGSWNLQFDWLGTVTNYLAEGWKLVEVFLDQNNKQMADRTFMASKITIDLGAMFIFEKPSSKMNDKTAVYEVKMTEYHAPGSMKMAGLGKTTMTITGAWENTIENEGRNGWELVRILQTPAMKFEQSLSMTPKFGSVHYMFFEREIMVAPVEQKLDTEPPRPTEA